MENSKLRKTFENPIGSNKAKMMLPYLCEDWVDWFINTQKLIQNKQPERNQGKGLLALCLLATFGLTAKEIDYGLTICTEKNQDSKKISVAISNTKRDKDSELLKESKQRILHISNDNFYNVGGPTLWEIYEQTGKINMKFDFKYSTAALAKLIDSLNIKFVSYQTKNGIKTDKKISPSFFRHQLCADMFNSNNYDLSEMSAILGLKNIYSLRNYSLKSKSKSKRFRSIEIQPNKDKNHA